MGVGGHRINTAREIGPTIRPCLRTDCESRREPSSPAIRHDAVLAGGGMAGERRDAAMLRGKERCVTRRLDSTRRSTRVSSACYDLRADVPFARYPSWSEFAITTGGGVGLNTELGA